MSEVKTDKISSVSTNGDITLDPDGTGDLIVASGNVGIGTASPSANLEISNDGNAKIDIVDSGSGDPAVRLSVANSAGYVGTTTDHSFRFIANDSEVGRFLSGGGLTFNGDTAAANALDDYEEGTFDASIHDGTTTPTQTESGYYVKIGKMVHIHGQTNISGSSSNGSILRITLPFQVVSDARGALAVGLNQPCSLTTNGEYLSLLTEFNSTNAFIISHAFGGGHTHLDFNALGTGIFSFGGSYRTA